MRRLSSKTWRELSKEGLYVALDTSAKAAVIMAVFVLAVVARSIIS
jgi:hypothetical protein